MPPVAELPSSPSLTRWLGAGVSAVLIGVVLFLLVVSERVPELKSVNLWVLCLSPVVLCVVAFGARAYVYGGALSHYHFLEEQSQEAHRAWTAWAQRHLAIQSCCLILPEQVSAATLMEAGQSVPACPPVAKRISALPSSPSEREHTGLHLLMTAVAPSLAALPAKSELRVTVLCDSAPEHHERLKKAWLKHWQAAASKAVLAHLVVTAELSYGEIERRLKEQDETLELLVVLQVHGENTYSDGLTAFLFSPDGIAGLQSNASARLLRPMPLDPEKLDEELPMFLQTQIAARQAVGVLADCKEWQPALPSIVATAVADGMELKAENQWTQSALCGLSGPFVNWLTTALGAEMVLHQQRPLLLLSREREHGWITTLAPGSSA